MEDSYNLTNETFEIFLDNDTQAMAAVGAKDDGMLFLIAFKKPFFSIPVIAHEVSHMSDFLCMENVKKPKVKNTTELRARYQEELIEFILREFNKHISI